MGKSVNYKNKQDDEEEKDNEEESKEEDKEEGTEEDESEKAQPSVATALGTLAKAVTAMHKSNSDNTKKIIGAIEKFAGQDVPDKNAISDPKGGPGKDAHIPKVEGVDNAAQEGGKGEEETDEKKVQITEKGLKELIDNGVAETLKSFGLELPKSAEKTDDKEVKKSLTDVEKTETPRPTILTTENFNPSMLGNVSGFYGTGKELNPVLKAARDGVPMEEIRTALRHGDWAKLYNANKTENVEDARGGK